MDETVAQRKHWRILKGTVSSLDANLLNLLARFIVFWVLLQAPTVWNKQVFSNFSLQSKS